MYIDGVFSGGGIKGYALIGACEAIEKQGFRFKRMAGTSAGSMIAAMLAAGYTAREAGKLVDEMDLKRFMDLRNNLFPLPFAKWLLLYWRLGLYKGAELERWIQEKLAAKGLRTFGDLHPETLRVVASDLTNGRLMIIPDDLPKYGLDPRRFSVAKAIRMSCSLPFFFEPVKIKDPIGNNIIVDGGVLSNFPMWLFDKENVKKVRPVIGIRLSHNLQEHPRHKISNAVHMFEALFETMKDAHDSRYISRRHEKNIIFVPVEGVSFTDFGMSDEKKEQLKQLGRNCAQQFLRKWCY
ncbi:patatin-like phospholipase family protein [Bacillus massilinigeriensis]|uniref:patatin-like phospholipase family protein n=1 Tax=Bacillus mediterraneensis TaxID=1805474 RepID=UPI0008F829BF|nr:patatin-like phospholipase family protein [Bacillus mediterraneensis]